MSEIEEMLRCHGRWVDSTFEAVDPEELQRPGGSAEPSVRPIDRSDPGSLVSRPSKGTLWLAAAVLVLAVGTIGVLAFVSQRAEQQATVVDTPPVDDSAGANPPTSVEVTGLPEGFPATDFAWQERARPEIVAIKSELDRRIGEVRFAAPATYVFPVVGLTAEEKAEIESRSPDGGDFEAVDTDVSSSDLDGIRERLRAELGDVPLAVDLGTPIVQVIVEDVDPELERRVLEIASSYLQSTDLPAGASTEPSDYVEVHEGSFSN